MTTSTSVRLRRTLPVAAALVVFAVTTPAVAHVTVTAPDAAPGASDVEITFRVPDEMPPARTLALEVAFPLDTPIAGVLAQPAPGWTVTEKTSRLAKPIVTDDGDVTEAVSEVAWQATGAGIGPGQFGSFTVIAGQLPDAKSLTFKAIQTYSTGKKVSWIEVAAPGSNADVEHPAPVLALQPAASAKDPGKDGAALPIAVAALAVACAGATGGAAAYWRCRRRP